MEYVSRLFMCVCVQCCGSCECCGASVSCEGCERRHQISHDVIIHGEGQVNAR